MAKSKETRTSYSSESITTVSARGQTEIPRPLRERYGVKAKSRLRWKDTGKGLLITPIDESQDQEKGKRPISKENSKFLAWFQKWMKEPDDWTQEQWDEFEQELRTNRLKFRDTGL